MTGKLWMTKVGLVRTGGEDEAVVRSLTALAQGFNGQAPRVEIDSLHVSENHRGVSLVAQDVPDRRRDISFGENTRRHLIQERLKEVVVAAVDNSYINLSAPQCSSSEQTPEATADNGDPMAAGRWNDAHRALR